MAGHLGWAAAAPGRALLQKRGGVQRAQTPAPPGELPIGHLVSFLQPQLALTLGQQEGFFSPAAALRYLPGNTALQLQQLRPALVFVCVWVVL